MRRLAKYLKVSEKEKERQREIDKGHTKDHDPSRRKFEGYTGRYTTKSSNVNDKRRRRRLQSQHNGGKCIGGRERERRTVTQPVASALVPVHRNFTEIGAELHARDAHVAATLSRQISLT